MPAVAKTSDAAIVKAARKLVEREGAASLSMQAVAEAVGVRAPSLYKRFPDREALLNAVALEAIGELQSALSAAGPSQSAAADLTGMARAYRAFARRAPRLYALIFWERPNDEAVAAARAAAVAPVFARLTVLVGPARVLDAARFLTAWLHGFVSMEIGGAFRLGGSVDEAFTFGVTTLVGALRPPRRPWGGATR